MDIRNNRLYPYPIRGKDYGDYLTEDFDVSIDMIKDGSSFILNFNSHLNDPVLKKLIRDNKVKYCYHLECSKTAFREVIKTDNPSEKCRIDGRNVFGLLQVCPFLIATENIENYSNPDFVKDYKGMVFNIDAGCPLAIGKQVNFDIEKNNTDSSSRESIFSICPSHDKTQNSFKIEFYNEDKITITLPALIYEQYGLFNQNAQLRPILHSIVIIPALIYVLDTINAEYNFNKQLSESFTGSKWFRTLSNSINELYNVDICTQSLEGFRKKTYEIAQELVRTPLIGSFEYLKTSNID